jgi:hypothetical protein
MSEKHRADTPKDQVIQGTPQAQQQATTTILAGQEHQPRGVQEGPLSHCPYNAWLRDAGAGPRPPHDVVGSQSHSDHQEGRRKAKHVAVVLLRTFCPISHTDHVESDPSPSLGFGPRMKKEALLSDIKKAFRKLASPHPQLPPRMESKSCTSSASQCFAADQNTWDMN